MASGWAMVTGASSGIGMEFAHELAGRGYPVLAVARRRERLDALENEAARWGGRIEPLCADLSTESGMNSVVRCIEQLDEIALLINNAGIANGDDFLKASLDQELAAIRLNIGAVVILTHKVLPIMIQKRRGAIINVASVVGFQPFPHFAVYAATKAFVLSFSEALAEEVKGTGVRILALCPGSVTTELEVFAHNQGLLGKLPSLSAHRVVETGLQALERGRVVKVVGVLNQFLPFMGRCMPRLVTRKLMAMSVQPPQPTPVVRAGS